LPSTDKLSPSTGQMLVVSFGFAAVLVIAAVIASWLLYSWF
jgi:hypothetical protein